MLILPIGQADSEVRRQPWVSYALIAINVCLFLMINGSWAARSSAQRAELRAKAREVFVYLVEHPQLETPETLRRIGGRTFEEALAEARAASPPGDPPDASVIDRERTELDALVAELVAIRARNPLFRLGFTPNEPHVAALLSHMFLHAGLFHLLGNMLFLFVTGPFLEDVFGRPLFTLLYLVGGVAAAGAHAAQTATPSLPLVGASGAIAAVMGAFLIRLGAARMKLLVMPVPIIWMWRYTVRVPAFVFLPFWLGEQLVYAHVAPEEGVAWWAHIGGFAFGMGLAGLVRLTRIEERLINPAIEKEISLVRHPSLEKAIDARTRGEFERARHEIGVVLRAQPNDLDAWAESFALALDEGNRAEAARVGIRLLDLYQRANEPELAAGVVEEALQRIGDQLPPKFYLSAAAVRERGGDVRGARDLYDSLVTRHAADPNAFWGHFRTGRLLARAGDPKGAREAYQRARAHPACLEPQLVEQALAELERAGRAPRPQA